jgi:hypothetical protein
MAAVQGEPLIDAHEHRLTASGETSVLIMQWLRQQFPASKQPRQGFQNPDGAQDAVKRVLQCQVPLADGRVLRESPWEHPVVSILSLAAWFLQTISCTVAGMPGKTAMHRFLKPARPRKRPKHGAISGVEVPGFGAFSFPCIVTVFPFLHSWSPGAGQPIWGRIGGGRQEPPRILSGSWIHAAFSAAVRSGETEFEPSVPVWDFRFQDRCRHDAFGQLNIPRNNRALDLSPAGRNHGNTLVDHHSGVIF